MGKPSPQSTMYQKKRNKGEIHHVVGRQSSKPRKYDKPMKHDLMMENFNECTEAKML